MIGNALSGPPRTGEHPLQAMICASFQAYDSSIYGSESSCGDAVGRCHLCYNPPLLAYFLILRSYPPVVLFARLILASITFVFLLPVVAGAQNPAATQTPAPVPTESPKSSKEQPKANGSNPTAEQIAETTIAIYGAGGGRVVLDQIRKTTIERGTTTVTQADGKTERANYDRFVIRGGSLDKEKIRLDQKFPGVTYSLIKNGDRVFMIYNDTVFTPREDAARSFQNQNYRGLDGLLRYKENESKIESAGKETRMGVEYHRIDVTDKQGVTTRYFVSAKTYRIMMLDYEEGGSQYQRKFYDYNYAQGTLVPYKTVLYKDGKVVEDTEIGTITFGQKVDEALFPEAT